MKKLFILLFVLATVMVANAQDTLYIFREDVYTNDNYNFEEEYLDITDWCVNSDTLIIHDGQYDPEHPFDVYWACVATEEIIRGDTLVITKGVNEGLYEYRRYSTDVFFRFMITLATEPEELKVSFEREVPLEPCGTEIFAYDLIDGEENPRLSCLWDDGETSYSRIVYDDGTYTVTVSDSCGRQVTNTWFVGDYTGTHESVASSPSIYPNPSNGVFTIEGSGTYSIYNTVGQLVKTINVEGMQKVALPSGLYFVRNDETTTKVVVE